MLAEAKKGAGDAARPTVNQLRLSPGEYGRAETARLLAENAKRGVLVQAWSPLRGVLGDRARRAVCARVGERYGKSAAQVALRWIVQSGASFATQSSSLAHFREDLDVYDFALTPAEMDEVQPYS